MTIYGNKELESKCTYVIIGSLVLTYDIVFI